MKKSHSVLFFQIRNCLTPKCFPQLLIPPCKSCIFIDAYLFPFFKESHIKTSCSGFQKSFVSPSGTVQCELLNSNLYPPLALSFAYLLLKKCGQGDRSQIGIEKSNSTSPFLRFLELHVAGEQQNNAEKAEFPLGPRVKLLPPWCGSAPVLHQRSWADFGQIYHWSLCICYLLPEGAFI